MSGFFNFTEILHIALGTQVEGFPHPSSLQMFAFHKQKSTCFSAHFTFVVYSLNDSSTAPVQFDEPCNRFFKDSQILTASFKWELNYHRFQEAINYDKTFICGIWVGPLLIAEVYRYSFL